MLLKGSFTAACRAALKAAIAIVGRYFVLLTRALSIKAVIAAKSGSFTLVLALPRICRQIYCTDFPRLAASISYLRNFCALSEANVQSTIPPLLLETFNVSELLEEFSSLSDSEIDQMLEKSSKLAGMVLERAGST